MALLVGDHASPDIPKSTRLNQQPLPNVPAGDPSRPFPGSAPLAAQALPVSAANQVRLGAVLIIADLAVVSTALCSVASVGNEWLAWLAGLGGAAGLQAAGFAFGLYNVRTAAGLRKGIVTLLWLGCAAVGLAMLGVFGVAEPVSMIRRAIAGFAVILVLVLLRLFVAAWLDHHGFALAERLLLIGTSDAVACLLAAGRPTCIPQRFIGVIAVGDARQTPIDLLAAFDPQRDDRAALVEDFWRIGDALRAHNRKIDRVVIASAGLDEATLAATLGRLEHLPFEIALVPPGATLSDADDPLDRSNCLVLRRPAITQWGLVCKRAFDVMAAAILLIILSPLCLVVATLIRLSSPGPALFRQTRWGWNNEPFTVFKFRTMWADAPAVDGSVQATRGDKRVTPIGAFLRSTSLDELPQLLNVLNGTMSLVGPRPHPVELNLRCLGVIDRYAGRHRVMPGITGLAQINGYRGETRSSALMQKRVDFDLEYIRTRSLGTDIWILIRTVGSVVRRVNAY